MGKNSGIEWTDHTFNPWWGCVKVSEGCAHCYAETFSKRLGMDVWGKGKPRRFFDDRHWNDPYKWNLAAEKVGMIRRVFCASMADVFEDAPGLGEQRARLYALIESTPHLEWLLLTKREEELQLMLPARWLAIPPKNVRIGVSAENQKWAARRKRSLLIYWRGKNFVSCEPLLGPVDLEIGVCPECGGCGETAGHYFQEDGMDTCDACGGSGRAIAEINWVIVGGESGHSCRPMEADWAVQLVHECKAASVPVFVKQLGGHPDKRDRIEEFPAELQIREYPE